MNKTLLIVLGVIVVAVAGYFLLADQGANDADTGVVDPNVEDQGNLGDDGLGTDGAETTPSEDMTVTLSAQNNSGQSGTATLAEVDGQTMVSLSLTGGEFTEPQPAHIHTGTCAQLGDVLYPLDNVVDGESTTDFDFALSQLEEDMPLAINVHESTENIANYTSCGNITF